MAAALGLSLGRLARLLVLVEVVSLVFTNSATAAQVVVGPGGDFNTVEAAINGHTYGPGDIIEIRPGTFEVGAMLRPLGSGQAGSPIVVRGAGMGRTIISGAPLKNSKALWDVEQGNRHWTFEDMTVRSMRGEQTNARGFFLVGCEDVVLQRVEITDCWNGIMSASGAKRVTVQLCNIHHCGGLAGPAHNIYMNSGENFVIQHNWLHDAQYGMCYKDRTHNLVFRYNLVENADIEGYEVSLAGDGSADQGETLLLGNVFIKSRGSSQQTHFVRFENGRTGTLTMIHNTLIAQANNVVISSIASRTTLTNNIIVGGRGLWSSGTLEGTHNWLDQRLEGTGGLVASLRGSDPGFVNPNGGDYRLAAGSPCIDAGVRTTPAPQWQWHSLGDPLAREVTGSAPDLGAYESGAPPGGTSAVLLTWSDFKRRYR